MHATEPRAMVIVVVVVIVGESMQSDRNSKDSRPTIQSIG